MRTDDYIAHWREERRKSDRNMKIITWVICLAIIVAIVGVTVFEHEHPCTAYGPEKLVYMQKVGEGLIPIYGKDCLERR